MYRTVHVRHTFFPPVYRYRQWRAQGGGGGGDRPPVRSSAPPLGPKAGLMRINITLSVSGVDTRAGKCWNPENQTLYSRCIAVKIQRQCRNLEERNI